jgi:hypothetical protein
MAESGSSDVVAFQHQPLNLTKQQIRLVKMLPHPSSTDLHVHISIVFFDFDIAPAYTALSYAWGPSSPVKTVMIDGLAFKVRQNLYDFLCVANAIQTKLEARFFWIDQICINQQDEREKGHQVQFMGEIFRRAHLVIAWVGTEDKDSEFTIKWMKRTDLAATDLSPDQQEHLWAFFSRNYWSRVWIVQELILASEVVFVCGCTTFTWHDIQKVGSGSSYMMYNAPNVSALCRLHLDAKPKTLRSALDAIHGNAPFQCHLPHDVVYGLLGLVSPTERVVVDYASTPQDVVTNVVEQSLPSIIEEVKRSQFPYEYFMVYALERLVDICCRAMSIPYLQTLDRRRLWFKVTTSEPPYWLIGERD